MARIFIPAQLRDLVGGLTELELPGETVEAVVLALDRQFPGIAQRLCPSGTLAPGLAVSVDGALVPRGIWAKVNEKSEIHFLPAIGGG